MIIATIEARMAATRLPGKIVLPIMGKPMLEHLVNRVKLSKYIDQIIIASSTAKENQILNYFGKNWDTKIFFGSNDNITDRLLRATEFAKDQDPLIIQLTADNPLICPKVIDRTIEYYLNNKYDYVANNLPQSYPLGMEVKIFKRSILEKVAKLTNDPVDLVHGSYYIYTHPEIFKIGALTAENSHHYPDLRLTVDEANDFSLASKIFENLSVNNPNFDLTDLLNLIKNNPDLVKINSDVIQKQAIEG